MIFQVDWWIIVKYHDPWYKLLILFRLRMFIFPRDWWNGASRGKILDAERCDSAMLRRRCRMLLSPLVEIIWKREMVEAKLMYSDWRWIESFSYTTKLWTRLVEPGWLNKAGWTSGWLVGLECRMRCCRIEKGGPFWSDISVTFRISMNWLC